MPADTHVLCHTRVIIKSSRPRLMGPMVTRSASAHGFFCPHTLFSAAGTLLGQWKMRRSQICLAGIDGFSVIPGILHGGGSSRGTGPPFGTVRRFYSFGNHTWRVTSVPDVAGCMCWDAANRMRVPVSWSCLMWAGGRDNGRVWEVVCKQSHRRRGSWAVLRMENTGGDI